MARELPGYTSTAETIAKHVQQVTYSSTGTTYFLFELSPIPAGLDPDKVTFHPQASQH
ncbi:hypothetical protein FOMG_12549 [Fusarium oxysporum f. sp. melonis 26406]|uniref:Uncharacterized protein n=1 Tax=Fusarium oxysporum f. sp. melonis 26406 TaxID=1089452 RepID=W9ZKI5_FUSOX|nr:hypothetical protein FOMG_12549 [Fusarium oxysporum f. sp. melonis 26406]